MEGSERHNFGHKRNPTDALYNHKEVCHYDPLTPRELIHRPTLGSFKNLPPNSSRKTSKSKDPYLLNKFQKPKKASKVTTLKENKEKEKDVYTLTGHKPSKS